MPPGVAGRRTAPTSIPEPKILYPTMEEFSDFMGYIKSIEESGDSKAGICKIVPPKEWVPRKAGYDLNDMNYTIQGPIKQNFKNFGDRGCFQTKGIIRKEMSVLEYHKMAHSDKYKTPRHDSYDDLEKLYWKSLAYGPPVYGCDVSNAISDPDLKVWNIAKLDSILKTVSEDLNQEIQGVNTPYLYFGMWKATFSWHVEDMDLYAINHIHKGMPKTWYCVPPEHGHLLEKTCTELFPHVASFCNNFMRHKTCLINPKVLDKYGVPYNKMIQKEREIIVVFPYAYHSGFNHGFNIAESTNFALERWVEFGKRSNPCTCERARVKFSMDPFVKKYQPETYEKWKAGLDIAPHPYDPPEKVKEVLKRAANPEEFVRKQEEKKRKEEERKFKKMKTAEDNRKKQKAKKDQEKREKEGSEDPKDEETSLMDGAQGVKDPEQEAETTFDGLDLEAKDDVIPDFTHKEDCTLIRVYRVNGFDSIEVEVNANTMEIQTGKSALEEHLGKTGGNLSDYTVDSLITSGVLYKSLEKRINKNKNGKRKLETAVTSSGNGNTGRESGSETDGGQQQQLVTEKQTVAMYKHVGEEGLHITVDPTTKELTSKPSKRLIDFLKNAGPATTVAQLITIGVFGKICDCIMEVKKVEKLAKSTQGQTPLAKKPKLEQQQQQKNGLDEPMEQELMEQVKPVGVVGPPGSPTKAPNFERAVKSILLYRHRHTGEHFSLSESKKLMGRLSTKTKELFETKSPQEMIEDGTLQLMGTRSVKPQFDHGIFRLLVDDQSNNRKIEIAFQGDVAVFTFDTDQQILDIILEGEENFIRLQQPENLSNGNGISDENNDVFKSSPKGILKELLNLKPNSDMSNHLHSIFADSVHSESNVKGIISECNYDADKETLVFKESITGRCYVRKIQILPAAIFQPTSVSAVAPVEETVVIKEVEKPVKTLPPTPKPAAAGGALSKKEETEDDDFVDDEDSDESQLYTSDESSESNDEGSDDPGYYGGSIGEWKSSNRSSKKKKVKELRNLRALNAERRDERRTEKRERRERRGGTSVKRQRRLAEEGPALIEMTKKILSMDTLKPEQEIDLETLENELRENNTGGRSRLTAVMTIFRGFRIVRKLKNTHNKFIWLGRDEEEVNRVLTSMLETSNSTDDILWNICSEVLQALMTARKASRVFLPIIAENFAVNESRRLTMVASILEGMGMVEKAEDELGGLIYKGPVQAFDDFKQNLWDSCGATTEYNLKKVKLSLPHVEVKEEHRYPIEPPKFVNNYLASVSEVVVPDELKEDLEIQRAVANLNKVCRCGSMKEMEKPNTIKRMGQKAHNRTRVLIGGKRKMRCKKCTGCKAPRCNKCIFCIKASMKKPCENRKCLFPIVPKCPCFI